MFKTGDLYMQVCPKTLPNGGVFVPHIYHILRGVVKSNTNHLVERDEGTCVAVEICHGVEVPDRKLKQPDRDASRSEACAAAMRAAAEVSTT